MPEAIKFRPWNCWIVVGVIIFPWLSLVSLRNVQNLGETYTFLIIMRSRNKQLLDMRGYVPTAVILCSVTLGVILVVLVAAF